MGQGCVVVRARVSFEFPYSPCVHCISYRRDRVAVHTVPFVWRGHATAPPPLGLGRPPCRTGRKYGNTGDGRRASCKAALPSLKPESTFARPNACQEVWSGGGGADTQGLKAGAGEEGLTRKASRQVRGRRG